MRALAWTVCVLAVALAAPCFAAGAPPAVKVMTGKARNGKDKTSKQANAPETPPAGEAAAASAEQPASASEEKPSVKPAADKVQAGDLSEKDACKLRQEALCALLGRCFGDEVPIPCGELTAGCDQLPGAAAYSKKEAEGCAAAVKALSCSSLDGDMTLNPEAGLPACKAVSKAEESKPSKTTRHEANPGMLRDIQNLGMDLGAALGGSE